MLDIENRLGRNSYVFIQESIPDASQIVLHDEDCGFCWYQAPHVRCLNPGLFLELKLDPDMEMM